MARRTAIGVARTTWRSSKRIAAPGFGETRWSANNNIDPDFPEDGIQPPWA
ncbi:MAG: hypothetical protein U5Q44_02015 [Dehalococcoidia bacterium]|nr:hypothetical protein [Dehalococcoidia bacterium]